MLSGFLTSGRRLEADDLKSGYMARVKYFLFNNKMRVFLCQAAFTLILMFVSIPLVSRGFYLAIKLSGFSSVTKENFFDVLKKPGTIVYICLLILLVMIFMLLNLTMFVVMFDSELRHRRKGLVGYLVQVEKHFFRFFRKRKLLRLLYMIPFALAVYLPPLLMLLNHNPVTKYMLKICIRAVGKIPFWSGVILLYIICIMIMTAKFPLIRCLILGNVEAGKAAEKTRLSVRDSIRHFRFQFVWELSILLLCVIFYAAFLAASILVIKAKSDENTMLILFYEVYDTINIAAAVLLSVICGMFNISSVLQISRPKTVEYRIDHSELDKQTHYLFVGMLAVACMLAVYLNIRLLASGSTPTYASLGTTLVSAHRGASSEAPENTIPAIEKAIDEGADYVEIDVRLTADGEVVLMHDASTKRTSGRELLVCDSTYEELQQLDVGSYFSEEYADTKIPTLEEAIDTCKGKIMMNIELKTVRNDGVLEEKVAELITDNRMEEQCIVTSFKQKSLVRIKNYNPDIVTGYIYSFGYSNRTDYEAMDVLSIDARYLTSQVVAGAHKKGIVVCAWTVNNSSEMRRMMSIGVDNIITDRVAQAKRILTNKQSNAMSDILKYIFDLR